LNYSEFLETTKSKWLWKAIDILEYGSIPDAYIIKLELDKDNPLKSLHGGNTSKSLKTVPQIAINNSFMDNSMATSLETMLPMPQSTKKRQSRYGGGGFFSGKTCKNEEHNISMISSFATTPQHHAS
jgi:hypothetical protein